MRFFTSRRSNPRSLHTALLVSVVVKNVERVVIADANDFPREISFLSTEAGLDACSAPEFG